MPVTPERLAATLADRYRIGRELGQGGMATVWLAHDLKHDRPVAIKVLRTELIQGLGAERFLREIAITAQLDHPNILSLLDSGVIEPSPATQDPRLLYYVMPYIEGESLRDLLTRETQLPIDDALRIITEIADALDYAHRHGFLHRDLKPENILLQDGHARVADFGIARTFGAVDAARLTETGLALGTPHYMSPEQAAGQGNLDARSDVYALGCLLYEMLAGSPPFHGPTAQAIMARHAVDPVPTLHTVRSTVPAHVEAAIAKALAKVPADRFSSAAQFAAALTEAPPSVVATAPRQPVGWIAAIAASLAVAGGWLFVRSQPHVEPSASVIAVLPIGTNGDTALTRLSHDLVLTVSETLDGVGGIRAVDPQMVLSEADDSRSGQWLPNAIARGKRLGAGSVVVGNMVPQGSNVYLDLKLISTKGDSEPLARVTVTNSPDSISALTDSIAWALLRQVWRLGEPPSPSYASITTRSVLALRAFLDGERLSQAGNWSGAADAYAAAIKADSSFWLAGWRYDVTRGWASNAPPNPDLERGYRSHLSAFGERDQLLIKAGMSWDSGKWSDGLARFQAITKQFPADWLAWFNYADLLFHVGPLVGRSNAEVRAALQRTVELNPKMIPIWEHLAEASLGHDSTQAALAVNTMAALGGYRARSAQWGFDASLFERLRVSPGGQRSAALLDSLVAGISASKAAFPHMLANYFLQYSGYPAAQVELNRRLLTLDPHGPFAEYAWDGMVQAWAARGAWDSALVAMDRHAAVRPDASPVDAYRLAMTGASLGALDTALAVRRRAAAVNHLAQLSPDSSSTRHAAAILAWADGMLALMRHDPEALAAARVRVHQSGTDGARFLDRSLAGLEMELKGATRAAADSLGALDMAATDAELFGSSSDRDLYVTSIDHLAAARLLLQRGDTARAVRLLTWHDADMANPPAKLAFQVFAAPAYYELARIEEAQGRYGLARDDYEQFLRRYDMPPPAHQYRVDEAKASLRKLNGLNEAPP